MDILVVGGGGREHAIIKSIKKSPLCGKSIVCPETAVLRQMPNVNIEAKTFGYHSLCGEKKG
jgi:phosphoribosylamine-glycine ligase